MEITLALDASTYAGSVAILAGKELVAERVLSETDRPVRGSREEAMMPAIAECLRDGALTPAGIDRIVCGEGPGSFTSLRIAASLSKGLAHSLGIPLYSVSSLLLLADCAEPGAQRIVAAINAMRGECFAATFEVVASAIAQTNAPVILADTLLAEYAASHNAQLVRAEPGGAGPKARSVARVLDALLLLGPVDLASWEPTYGRLAEAQVRWEKAAGRPLTA